jgi:hypothetical protein
VGNRILPKYFPPTENMMLLANISRNFPLGDIIVRNNNFLSKGPNPEFFYARISHPYQVHCNENSIYVFLFWKLRDLSLNFHIHVSVSDLYIPRIGPHISLQQNRQIDRGNIHKSLTDTWMWKLVLWPCNSFSGNICFQFSVLVLCNV